MIEDKFQEYISWLKQEVQLWRDGRGAHNNPEDKSRCENELFGLEMALQKAEYYFLDESGRKHINWEKTWFKKIMGF